MLGDSPPVCNQEPFLIKDKDGSPQEDLVGALLLCMQRWCTVGRSRWGDQVYGM